MAGAVARASLRGSRKRSHPAPVVSGDLDFTRFKGVNVHPRFFGHDLNDPMVNTASDIGAKTLRADFEWADYETADNVYSTDQQGHLDIFMANCLAAGIDVLPMVWYTPGWANGNTGRNRPPSNPAKYAEFCAYVAARYPQIKHIEIGNEPDLDYSVATASGTLAQRVASYIALCSAARTAIKAVRSDIKIVGPATANAYGSAAWLTEWYAQGGNQYVDVLSAHFYADPPAHGQSTITPEQITATWKTNVFSIIAANGDSAKELWLSEIGWNTSTTGVTQEMQADYVTRIYAAVRAQLPTCTRLYYYQLHDDVLNLADPEKNYGLATVSRTNPGQPNARFVGKPALAAYAAINDRTLITGNSKGYSKAPWKAYTGMWGLSNPQAPGLAAFSAMRIAPATFPAGTTFSWDVIPSPNWNGVNGFLHIGHGNYDDGEAGTPRQVNNIASYTVSAAWSMTGDNSSGLLCEVWLAAAAATTGQLAKTHEVAFFPRCSPPTITWLNGLAAVGAGFTDSNGVAWLVKQSLSGTGEPYFIAYRPSFVDHQGALPFHSLLSYLKGQGKITGNEWVNGVGFGVEPHSGAGTLTIDTISVSATAGSLPVYVPPGPPVVDTFTAATLDTATKWKGATYGGLSIVSGRLRVPCSNSFPQAATGAVQDLTKHDVWVEVPTLPSLGNGSKQTQFLLNKTSNYAGFNFPGTTGSIALQLTGQTTTYVTYNATAHRWARFRLSAGDLLWQVSPDNVTWTTVRTFAAPAWITGGLVDAVLSSSYWGTETEGTFAEFDNFCA